jgi:hypothetical protein
MADLDGFDENPQSPLDSDEPHVIDESIWGPQKVLTPEEQADYDAWFRRKIGKALEDIKNPDAVFLTHDEVMKNVEDLLDKLERENGFK